ncbi:putative ATP-dependent RNA helicase ddx4 [Porites harrisoni]
MDGGSRWQPAPRNEDSGHGERMTSYNSSYSGPKGSNFSGRSPRREEHKVYIKNVPLDMDKDRLQALFSGCGNVVSANVLAAKEGRSNTIGFVGFAAEEEVNIAIEKMNGTVLGNDQLVVEKAMQRDRGGGPKRDQDSQFQRRGNFQNFRERHNEPPPFQGYRNQNGPPQSNMEQPYYSEQSVNGFAAPMNSYHGGMGVHQEEPLFNPRGPGRGGNPNGQTSFQGYQGQHFPEPIQWSGNMEQQNYPQQTINGSELMNSYQPMGVRREEAVYNPRGPGRGGGYQHEQQSFQGYQQSYSEQPMTGGNFGQQYNNYSRSSANGSPVTSYQQSMGGRYEEATFNPQGPGRGGGVINQSTPPQAPGGGNSYMNGMTSDYSNFEGQGNSASWTSEGQQQHWGHTTRDTVELQQQDMSMSGRLPRSVEQSGGRGCRQISPNKPQGEYRDLGNITCHTCGEVGHMSRECPSSGGLDRACHNCGAQGHFAKECPAATTASSSPERGGRGCFKCGETGHFARECPQQEDDGGRRGPESKVAPVTYIPPELPSDINELFQDAPHSGLNFDKYDEIPVKVTGKEIPSAIDTFEQAGILEQCSSNIKKAKFMKPTPIQKHAIPIVLAGRDLMACAQTGSGKTVAYLVPVLTSMIKRGLLSGGYLTGETQAPTALCLAPTRELAVQIHREVCKFANETVVTAAVCYGGVSVRHQADKIRRGCHFLVATPGRLIDFVDSNRISLESVRYLILDEADRMLDMGFEKDVRKIVEMKGMPDKTERQTLMFSATFPDEIQRLAADFLKEQYLFVAVGKIGGSNLDISQSVISVPGDDKKEKLFELLLNSGTDRTLIFVELKRVADFLAVLLSQNNFPTTSISGDRTQQEREAALRDFRTGRAPVLVATSVAARGLDIPDVKHVINFDLPQDIEEYVHRIGRTGRIGNKGKATSFFQPGKDERLARSLVKILSEAYQDVPEWLEQVAEEAIGSSYGPAGGKFASKDRRERDHPRSSAPIQQRMNGPTNGMDSVTRGMERVSVQPPSQFSDRRIELTQDEDDWD